MLFYKIHLIFLIISVVSADFHYDHFKIFGVQAENPPWFFHDPIVPQASHLTQNYHVPYDSTSNYRESDSHSSYQSSSDPYFGSSTKVIPRENKFFKKSIYPFYTISDKDDPKHKSMIMKSGLPFCQKVKSTQSNDKEFTVCYKCKNPKTGLNYEHCSKIEKPSATRIRRSNSEESSEESSEEHDDSSDDYRFGEEYFLPQASLPIAYKKKRDNCERIVKDSMVCMACKDPETNEKYEQCSYVTSPSEKAYAYSKSSSFDRPKVKEQGESSAKKPIHIWHTHEGIQEKSRASEPEYDDEEESPAKRPTKTSYGDYSDYRSSLKDNPGSSSTVNESKGCKKVFKDSQTCIICKDSERCFYEYQPSDKIYKYTRSKSFGYPTESESKSESKPRKTTTYVNHSPKYSSYDSESAEEKKDAGSSESEEDYEYRPSNTKLEYESESEKIAAEAKSSDCQEVQKDSMICTICKDPKTGDNSERCAYSYKPSDKLFSYSKSKSFGSPTKTEDESYYADEESASEPEYVYGRRADYSADDADKYATEKIPQKVKHKTSSLEGSDFSTDWEPQPAHTSKVDIGYFDTSKRKAEIEKYLEEFKAEDRSKCQKVMRDKMTCYQCVDENGFRKEECMFVTAPEATENRPTELESHAGETKQKDKKVKREPAKNETPLEPMASASDDSYVAKVKPDADDKMSDDDDKLPDETENTEEKVEQVDEELLKEAEPYDTASQTKYVYDKVLGFSLPAYMLETSEQEAEFDHVVATSSF